MATKKSNDNVMLLLLGALGIGAAVWFYTKQSQAQPGGGYPPTPPLPPGGGGTYPPVVPPGGTYPGGGTYPPTPPIPPIVPPTTQPPNRQLLLASDLANNLRAVQQQFGVKLAKGRENKPLAKEFQRGEGLLDDGLSGPKTLLRMAQYIGVLPFVQYWPKAAKEKDLAAYKAELERIAQAASTATRAAELRASAAREKGQAGLG